MLVHKVSAFGCGITLRVRHWGMRPEAAAEHGSASAAPSPQRASFRRLSCLVQPLPQNMEIDAVCRGLEAEVAAMREALPRDGPQAAGGGAAGAEQAAAEAAEQQQQGGQPNGVGEPAEGMQE